MALATQLAQLETAQLVRHLSEEEQAFIFKHALIQESAYTSLLKQERKELHRFVAEALEQAYPERLDENAGLLVYHYTEYGNNAKIFEYAARAATAAIKVYAYPEARAYLAQALAAIVNLPDNPVNRERRVDTLVEYLQLAWSVQPIPRMLELCAEAEQLVQSLVQTEGRSPENMARFAFIHYAASSMHMLLNELPTALDYYERALAEAQSSATVELGAIIRAFIGVIKLNQGDLDQADDYLKQAWGVLSNAPDRWESNICLGAYAMCAVLQGHAATLLPRLQAAQAHLEAEHNGFSLLPILNYVSNIYWHRGDLELAAASSLKLTTEAEKVGDLFYLSSGMSFQALVSSRRGQIEAADKQFAHGALIRERMGGRILADDWLAVVKAEIALGAMRAEEAQTLADQAVKLAQSVGGKFSEGWAERVWGQALVVQASPDWDAVDAHFAESLNLFEGCHARLEAARTHVAWGRVLSARGEADSAREHFEKAAAQFEASGLDRELGQVRASLSPAISS